MGVIVFIDDTPRLTSEQMKFFEISDFRLQFQWYNGYIILPHNPQFDCLDEIDINLVDSDIDAHGGINYGAKVSHFVANSNIPFVKLARHGVKLTDRIIGFDCRHLGDTIETCNEKFVRNEIENMGRQLFELQLRSRL